jgi:hypothetical protein
MKILLVAAVILGFALVAYADGFPITNGRYQGKTTVLRITDKQIASLSKSRDLQLTEKQRAQLKAETGVGPSQVYVYFSMDGENDHTCMAYNVAFRFSETEIEVPHKYAVSDEEAEKRRKKMEEM